MLRVQVTDGTKANFSHAAGTTAADGEECRVSVDVSEEPLAAARIGEVPDEQFAQCVRVSLPYAWQVIGELAARLRLEGGTFVENTETPPTELARAQLLRALASDAVRGCLERHFGVRLAFQNCLRLAAFPAAEGRRGGACGAHRTSGSTRSPPPIQPPE